MTVHGIILICKSLEKTGFVEGKVISFLVKLCLGCLEIAFVVKTEFVFIRTAVISQQC